ncbi:MAG: ABC transporter ATP-binding protein [Desulfobacterales bacterium]|nr:ABC transporter ATP-binding protein [Desulfobacterales bacterium]
MSKPIIKVENLSKRYRIGAKQEGYKTFREAIMDGFKVPIRNFRRLRKLTRFDEEFAKHKEHSARPTALPHAVAAMASSQSDDAIWALKDVSFEVQPGEALGIIGHNGAGKTTLLKILSRITEPTTGEAKIYGRVSSLLEVGTGFHPELTGRENIYLNGTILGMRKAEIDRKFDEIVGFAEIEKFIDTPVKRYSSGMYVRLAFAVAAHLEPEILLVDEVLAVGDVAFQKRCLGKMSDVAKEGRTVLFVSHNMAAVGGLCPGCIYLKEGCIKDFGPANSVILQYIGDFKSTKQISLAERTDRRGDGRVRVTGLRFLDTITHRPIESIISGQDVYIEVTYESYDSSPAPLNRVNIGLGFFTTLGQFVMVLNSEMASRAFGSLPREGRMYCRIPRFPLMPGVFHIKLTLVVRGAIADQLENVSVVNVDAGDFFGTGIPNDYRRQGVYVPHSWSAETPSVY